MDVEKKATFGGSAWVSRGSTLAEEIRAGKLWAAFWADSDCGPLTDVLLYRPGPGIGRVEQVDAALHLRRVDPRILGEQVDRLVETYQSLGVRVHPLPLERVDDERHPNAIFLRDVFWQTPHGAVISRMASPVRAGEEIAVSATLTELRVPIALTIAGDGLLEGADCLWLRPGLALVGIGRRTNSAGLAQLSAWLERLGARCLSTRFNAGAQHLSGCIQAVGPDRLVVRAEMLPPETIPLLRKSGFAVIALPESEEIRLRWAFNFVVLAPGVMLMPGGCPQTREQLEAHGLRVAAEVDVSEYLAMAGGPCCASGVLARGRM